VVNPRLRRLAADFDELQRRFNWQAALRIEPIGTMPPERYRVLYNVPTLRVDAENRPTIVHQTIVDLILPATYPREKPFAVSLDPVFHPNFAPDHICLADFWSPAQSLADIVVQIADMLQWRRYNIHSPLNAVAAEWAVSHRHELPIGQVELVTPSVPEVALGRVVVEESL
jgi:ubiquitin-protein ligase